MEITEIIILILVLLIIWLGIKLGQASKEKKKINSENRKLIADNALLETEQLKFQMQPHTLNNILANLKVTANKLNKGMDSLSETLDYILYKGNNHLVSVQDELDFISKYLSLNDLFISEIDSIKSDFSQVNKNSKYYTKSCIPHLITAYFIENAFKHGDIKHPEFLNIQVKLSDSNFNIIVINKTTLSASKPKGGIGLSNMKKRLELLLDNNFEVKTSAYENEYHSSLTIFFKNGKA